MFFTQGKAIDFKIAAAFLNLVHSLWGKNRLMLGNVYSEQIQPNVVVTDADTFGTNKVDSAHVFFASWSHKLNDVNPVSDNIAEAMEH